AAGDSPSRDGEHDDQKAGDHVPIAAAFLDQRHVQQRLTPARTGFRPTTCYGETKAESRMPQGAGSGGTNWAGLCRLGGESSGGRFGGARVARRREPVSSPRRQRETTDRRTDVSHVPHVLAGPCAGTEG